MSRISIMCCLQLGRKHILSSWRAIQYSLLSIFFICLCRDTKTIFCKICLKARNHLQHYNRHLIVASFSQQMGLKNKILLIFCTNLLKKEVSYIEISRDSDKKNAYLGKELQLQIHSLTSIHRIKSLPSATIIPSRSPMA